MTNFLSSQYVEETTVQLLNPKSKLCREPSSRPHVHGTKIIGNSELYYRVYRRLPWISIVRQMAPSTILFHFSEDSQTWNRIQFSSLQVR